MASFASSVTMGRRTQARLDQCFFFEQWFQEAFLEKLSNFFPGKANKNVRPISTRVELG